MAISNGFVVICFSVFLIALIGFYNVILNREKNGCNMTYMYEYPQFVKISLGVDVSRRYRAYSLWAYGEGRFTENVREMKFSGIPVLFIHGNRGSYKQVRSLSSVSLRKALRSRLPFHFDYFAVDLNEELSGFYGVVLEKQTEFVRLCISKILSLYRGPDAPTSVVLFAHSMGGMIAKGLFLQDMDWSQVRLIVTLATPHIPAVILDIPTEDYYETVTKLWDETDVGSNVTLISIGGGSRDLLLHSGLVFTPHADISIVSSDICGVWLETDHLSITWCKELVLVLVRALFDCVDLDTKQISTDDSFRNSVFRYHLLERSGSKQFAVARKQTNANKETVLWKGGNDSSSWLKLRKNQLTWMRRDKLTVTTNILVPLTSAAQPADTIVIRTVNHNTEHWLFACRPDVSVNNIKICSTGEDISWKGRISPTKSMKRKTAVLDLVSLKLEGKTHLVVRTLPTSEMVEVSFDLFVHSERGSSLQPGYIFPHDLVQKTSPGELFRWLEIPALTRPWNAFIVKVTADPANCSAAAGHSTMSVTVPWNNEGSHIVLDEDRNVIPITTYSAKPQKKQGDNVEVSIYLNTECSYTIRLEQSLSLEVGRLVVRNYPNLLAFVSVCLIMCLAKQLRCLGESASCPLLHIVAASAAKPYYILPAANISAAVFRFWYPLVPKSDVHNHSGLVETLVVPLLLHCSSVALLLVAASLVLVAVVFYGQAFNSVILKFVSKFCLGVPWISDWIMSCVSKLPIIISGLMLAISYSACSSLAIYIGLVFYMTKLVSYYEDFWDEVVYWPLRALKTAIMNRLGRRCDQLKPLELPPLRDVSFHLTIFLLWCLMALITTPSLLTWAHNFRYSTSLEQDPFFSVGIILSICGGFLWQTETPRTNLKWSCELSQTVLTSCVAVLVYCQTSLYRLLALLCTVLISVCLHQFAAPVDAALDYLDVSSPSALSSVTASFLKRLDAVLGNRPHPGAAMISGGVSGNGQTEALLTANADESSKNEEESTSEHSVDSSEKIERSIITDPATGDDLSDKGEQSVDTDHATGYGPDSDVDVFGRTELSNDLSELSFPLTADMDDISHASFDPADRPELAKDEETYDSVSHLAANQSLSSLSSNSSFENISFGDTKG